MAHHQFYLSPEYHDLSFTCHIIKLRRENVTVQLGFTQLCDIVLDINFESVRLCLEPTHNLIINLKIHNDKHIQTQNPSTKQPQECSLAI